MIKFCFVICRIDHDTISLQLEARSLKPLSLQLAARSLQLP
jgi:hypothetical protein